MPQSCWWLLLIVYCKSQTIVFALSTYSYQRTNIIPFSKHELHIIKERYHDCGRDGQIFNHDQSMRIKHDNLETLIRDLIAHPKIELNDPESLIEFAYQIKISGLEFSPLAKRIIKYHEEGETIFAALRKAIDREQFHLFKIERNREIRVTYNRFVENIMKLRLKHTHQEKVLNAYAICVDSFNYPSYRDVFLKPKICEPIDEYAEIQNVKQKFSYRETLSLDITHENIAYQMLISHAREVIENQKLSKFETILIAKCIAEQSLRFFDPSHHVLKAFKKTCEMQEKSPQEVFFMQTGVCSNFSGLSYNISSQLGLTDEVFLAKKGWHVYLEVNINGKWYHTHPFNSVSKCDFIKFAS